MSEISNREKRRRFVVFSATIVLIVLVLLFLAFAFFGGEKQDAQSSLKPVGAGNVQGGAGGEGTAEYNEKLEKLDEQKAEGRRKPYPHAHRQAAAAGTERRHTPRPAESA